MITVEQSAKTIEEGIKNLMAGAKQDYYRMSTRDGDVNKLSGYSKEQYDNWDNKVKVSEGKSISKSYRILVCFVLSPKRILNISKRVTYSRLRVITNLR